jgi:superfamily II DNA or RNA helicase
MSVRLENWKSKKNLFLEIINKIKETDKKRVISDYKLSEELYNFLKEKDDVWIKKYCSMICSFINSENFHEEPDSQIKNLLKSSNINKEFLKYCFDDGLVYKLDFPFKKTISQTHFLLNYKNLRSNQIDGITKTYYQNFTTGVHNHIMGSGKTVMELLHIDVFFNYYLDKSMVEGALCLFISSRINILNKIFFEDTDSNDYEKYGIHLNKYKIINYVTDDILNPKNIFSNKKANIVVCNIQYLKNIQENKIFKEIIKKTKLIIFDECHNISAPTTYKFINEFKKINVPIIGFSATPTRTSKEAKENFKEIFTVDKKVNIISVYDLFQGIMDDYILPFKIKQYEFKGLYLKNDNDSEKINYSDRDFKYNKRILRKILLDEIQNAPYCKFVAWCSSISNLEKWKKIIEEEFTKEELKVYVTHSGNNKYLPVNEYNNFYSLKPETPDKKINAILLNVNTVTEGCDIDFVDAGIFLDPVKNKNIVTYLQSAGRICRTDINNKKTHANIIYTYTGEKNIKQSHQIIAYFEMLMQLTEVNDDYYKKMTEMFAKLQIVNENELRFSIDNIKKHDCVLHLGRKIHDWNKIKKEITKIITERRKKIRDNSELTELNKLKQYDFTKSKIEGITLNDEVLNYKNYKPLASHLYKIIKDVDEIIKYTTVNIVKENKNDKGFKFLSDLGISIQGTDSNVSIYEIINMCTHFNQKIKLIVKLENNETIEVSYEDNFLNIVKKKPKYVKINNKQYLCENNKYYLYENNKKGELFAITDYLGDVVPLDNYTENIKIKNNVYALINDTVFTLNNNEPDEIYGTYINKKFNCLKKCY